MVATRVHRSGVNPNVLREGDRPGEFLISEVTAGYVTRENVQIRKPSGRGWRPSVSVMN